MARKRAILIGVDGYSFQPLTSAVNDVLALRAALMGEASGSPPPIVAETDITILATPASGTAAPAGSSPATRDAIANALRAHYDAADPIDFLLVYFAGHGLSASPEGRARETVILPSDVSGPEDGRNMISVTELIALFAERGPLEQLWIVDACRDMPYQRRPRGYSLEWPDQPAQVQRAQYAIFAVAPGGTALSVSGEQGRFTSHLIRGLGGNGCAAEHVPGRGHCVTAPSLCEYVRRRVKEALKGYDDFTKAIQLPQPYKSGSDLQPLRDLPPPPPREFRVTIEPAEAETFIQVALELEAGFPVEGWPPSARPRIYELRTALRTGAESRGWQSPKPALRAVDLREEDTAVIEVPRGQVLRGGAVPEFTALEELAPTSNWGVTAAATAARDFTATKGLADAQAMAALRVDAEDRAVTISARRAEPPRNTFVGKPKETIRLPSGVWDVAVLLGDETISETRIVLSPGESRVLSSVAQITPAVAALLPPQSELPSRVAVVPSETIGPMQTAILPTLLPLLAVKPFDQQNNILRQFGGLQIPTLAPPGDAPFAIAVAFDGPRRAAGDAVVRDATRVWSGADNRVMLLAGQTRGERGTLLIRTSDGDADIAAPVCTGGVTSIALTVWPGGRLDASISVFRLPIGTLWNPNRLDLSLGQIARALALADRLFRADAELDQASDRVLTDVAYAKWIDPVLGAIAFHAHDRRIADAVKRNEAAQIADLREGREEIRGNMTNHFGMLPDSRIIAALDQDTDVRRPALRSLLDDDSLAQPVLTASLAHLARAAIDAQREDHWAVDRFDRIAPGQVFNVVQTARRV